MRKFNFLLSLIVLTGAVFSCADEEVTPTQESALSKESLNGFWTYKQVLVNNVDINVLIPGFTVSNYLHLKDDDTYGKCYILGDWSIDGEYIRLDQSDFSNSPVRYYKVISVTENSLTLQIKLRNSQYEIGLSQFEANEVITVTEIFEK